MSHIKTTTDAESNVTPSKPKALNSNSLTRSQQYHKYNKRLRKDMRPVPWRDERELQAVGKSLLSVLDGDGDKMNGGVKEQEPVHVDHSSMAVSEALEMICVWKSRLTATQGLPHAIESTASLAEVYWRDAQRVKRQTNLSLPISISELRLSYSSAVIRTINGFADIQQQQRPTAASVAALCAKLGIPSWLVDVRHAAAHNTLPSIEILRLAASTLLEFLKTEYWITKCKCWDYEMDDKTDVEDTKSASTENQTKSDSKPTATDLLRRYQSCASSVSHEPPTTDRVEKTSAASTMDSSRRKRKNRPTATAPPKTRILTYDPLFGEVGTLSISEEDDSGDDEGDNDLDWDKLMMGNIWGSAIGTSINRFAILEPVKKKKKLCPVEKMPPKRRIEANTPTDCAKLFVKHISPQQGFEALIQFLVWGGIGGAPPGRGVLVPSSEKAFPPSQEGVSKCWQRYSPLVHIVCRAWPGFSATLLVHLVECVLSIEDGATAIAEMDRGTPRKLLFLSSWIQLVLSQRFVVALNQCFFSVIGKRNGSKSESSECGRLTLAPYEYLKCLDYPLHSLLDRCRQQLEKEPKVRTINPEMSPGSSRDTRKTSFEIYKVLRKILGPHFDCDDTHCRTRLAQRARTRHHGDNVPPETEVNNLPVSTDISLDEMESILADGDASNPLPLAGSVDDVDNQEDQPVWVRCTIWDTCSIGSLPGKPG